MKIFQRRKSASIFGTYVPREVIEAALKDGPAGAKLERKSVKLLFAAVAGLAESELSEHLAAVTALARESGWFICSLCSNLVVLADADALTGKPAKLSPAGLGQKLLAVLGDRCKTLGGERIAAWGDYGGETRRVFGPLLPDFLAIVAALNARAWGTHAQLDAS